MEAEAISKIRISNLNKSFNGHHVLRDVNLTIRKGETLVVLGRSGAGKSVLLKIMVGLQRPDSGSVWIDEKEITYLKLDELNKLRKKIGFLFQYSALFDSLSVADNVAFPLVRHTTMHESQMKQRVRHLLSLVGVENASEQFPAEISGGMRKRVALARALALDPEILLCDEPTAGLDPITSNGIDELIKNMQQQRNLTSVVVTHDLQSARTISTSVALLHEGEILIRGAFSDLLRSDNPFVKRFIHPTHKEEMCPERHA
jgi:phospholipid/cholesterol/gamma-HCH transport system ATP-binding protein